MENQSTMLDLLKKAFHSETQELDALIRFIMIPVVIPLQIVDKPTKVGFFENGNIGMLSVMLLCLPITIPLGIAICPILFASRQVKICIQKIYCKMICNELKIDSKKLDQLISEGLTFETQISKQTWKQAIEKASNELLIKKRNRLVVLKESGIKNEVGQIIKQSIRQYMFVVSENTQIWQLMMKISESVQQQFMGGNSLMITKNKVVLSAQMRISECESSELGVVLLTYHMVQSLG